MMKHYLLIGLMSMGCTIETHDHQNYNPEYINHQDVDENNDLNNQSNEQDESKCKQHGDDKDAIVIRCAPWDVLDPTLKIDNSKIDPTLKPTNELDQF